MQNSHYIASIGQSASAKPASLQGKMVSAPGVIWKQGVVVRGHRVASGLAADPAFPQGTIRPQLDAFCAAIPDLQTYLGGMPFAGTINFAFDVPTSVTPGIADYRIGPVRWSENMPAEIFLISQATLLFDGTDYPVYLYIPDPTTKPSHHQPTNVVELLATFIPGLKSGSRICLGYRSRTLSVI